MKLKELKWLVEEKIEAFMEDPKKRLIAAALAGFVIGFAVRSL